MPGPPNSIAVSRDSLTALAEQADTPAYDRDALRRSIIHIGVGGFHRAHLATYIDDLARQGETDWAIVGSGVLDGDRRMAEVLTAQDHLYTLISRSAASADLTVIGSIVDYVLAVDEPDALIERIADPDVQIVSLTITEGGYPVDDESGVFVPERSPTGGPFDLLVRGLDARRRGSGRPLTVMSCDNVMENGHIARTATNGQAARISQDLVAWIEGHVSFPSSMVDRITPATTPADVEWLERTRGVRDAWPVVAEPFRQWVVEDRFAGDRLPLERLDVIVTDDIAPYELTKLRLLNAGHSCLAYLAALEGHERVDEAMADPDLAPFVERLLRAEAAPTLPIATGIDIDEYISQLLARFANPGVGDQIARLCLDGSAKFPKFLLPTIRSRMQVEGPVDHAALALAGWCEYLRTAPSPAPDPLLDEACDHARRSADDPVTFLSFDAVFDNTLGPDSPFATPFVDALLSIRTRGVQSSLRRIAHETQE
ncbi:MAG: mannitol dehydrogenase family protein [Actinomycetota bacterium]